MADQLNYRTNYDLNYPPPPAYNPGKIKWIQLKLFQQNGWYLSEMYVNDRTKYNIMYTQ